MHTREPNNRHAALSMSATASARAVCAQATQNCLVLERLLGEFDGSKTRSLLAAMDAVLVDVSGANGMPTHEHEHAYSVR